MEYIGTIMIVVGIAILIVSEAAIISVKKMINKDIAEDIKKFKNEELINDASYKKDIEDFLQLMGTSTFILRAFNLVFISVGLLLHFI